MPDRIWVCNHPAHKGVRAPGRMRMDDVRRVCWPCSLETGYLVQRHAPALERKRKDAKAKRLASEAEARQRAQDARQSRETVDGIHIGREIKQLIKLPALCDELPLGHRKSPVPWTLHRSANGKEASGHAYPRHRIHFTFGDEVDAGTVQALIVHELTHYVLPRDEHHSQRFSRCFARALREGYGVEIDPAGTAYQVYARGIKALGGSPPASLDE